MVRGRGFTASSGLVVVAALGFVYAGLQPSYRLADQVPDKEQAVAASRRLDAELTGANPIDVLIEIPPGAGLYAPETLATIAECTRRSRSSPASAMSGRSRRCGAGSPRRWANRTSTC